MRKKGRVNRESNKGYLQNVIITSQNSTVNTGYHGFRHKKQETGGMRPWLRLSINHN